MLKFIKKSLFTQKTCFGPSLVERFSSTLLKYLSQSKIDSKNQYVSSPIRIHSRCLLMMRRAIRLFQMTCTMPGNASPIASIYQPIEAFVPLLARFKVIRYESYEVDWKPDGDSESETVRETQNDEAREETILVEKNGMKLDDKAKDMAVATREDSLLFTSRKSFLQWEAAVEMRSLIQEVGLSFTY
jgi:hypothetical protein